MRTVGQILKETREAKFYSLEDVEKAIKIQKNMLRALEDDDYSKLPPPTFVQGFIKNYARFLNLDPQKLLAIFRREFTREKQRSSEGIMESFAKPVGGRHNIITPPKLVGLVVTLVILSFFGYLWIQYRQFVGPPSLNLTTPSDQITVDNSSIVVEGSTDPEIKVLINSQEVPVDQSGHFKEEITLPSEINKISVVASSKFGQKNEIERTVYLKR
jgi:cytoskeletal protein RodZ